MKLVKKNTTNHCKNYGGLRRRNKNDRSLTKVVQRQKASDWIERHKDNEDAFLDKFERIMMKELQKNQLQLSKETLR